MVIRQEILSLNGEIIFLKINVAIVFAGEYIINVKQWQLIMI
jgi:hypothetical protein